MDNENPEFWVSKWGYEQTNVDFYLVVKKTASTVWLQKAAIAIRKNAGAWAQEYVAPIARPAKNAPVIRRKIKKGVWCGKEETWCRIASYSHAHPWDGKACLETSYA